MGPIGPADRQRVEQAVVDIVGELVAELGGGARGRGVVHLDDSLDRTLALGSLERVELLVRLDAALGVRLPDSVMVAADTPRDLAAALLAAQPAQLEPAPGPRPSLPEGRVAPASVSTLVEALRWHAEATPERVHIYLREEDGHERPITYGTLWARATAVAAGLRERGAAPCERVALMLRTEEAFFSAFFGALLAGGIPVPIYPPFRLDRIEEYARRQVGILRNAEASRLLTFPEAERVAGLLRARVPSLDEVVSVDRVARPDGITPRLRPAPDDPALIQYTSGSTGEPKGVLLSHANLLANIRAIGEAIALGPEDVGVSWLPLYHDMGLIGSWLATLHFGIPIVILSPVAFLSRPARWLWAIQAHRGTVSAAPNFAFDLCVRKVADDEVRGLDLGSWRLAFNGSETVSPDTIERFTRRFEAHGFRAEAMCPVYGLAEASVALCVPPLRRPPRVDRVDRRRFEQAGEAWPASTEQPGQLRFVSCGRPLPRHEVRIVDGSGRPLHDRVQGRVEFRGPSVTAGYFRNPEATRAALDDGWTDSGDLGYWADGELFLTGRRKDVIIKAGRNLHPQEVEEVVGDVPGIRKGCVAAFGVVDPTIGTERLVVAAETREVAPAAWEALRAAAVEHVVAVLGVPPDTVVICGPGSVLKTSSGKIRRAATREAYARGELGQRRQSAARQWIRLTAADLAARLSRVAGHAGRLAFTTYVGALLLPALAALWGLMLVMPRGRPADRFVRGWCRVMLALAGCRLRVEGLEHLRGTAPVVLAPNHSSYIDVATLLAALPVDFRFIAKRELLATPVVGAVIRKVGHLAVERADLSQSIADAERISAALRSSTSLIVFPEGTFRRAPGLRPFRLGAFKAAVEAGRPVVPVAIRGTREILPADSWLLTPGLVTVTLGAPIRPEGTGWSEMVRLRDLVRAEIAGRLEVDRG
jgi:1-acyl-sn-glycerol-3-phosphate acyltransferase